MFSIQLQGHAPIYEQLQKTVIRYISLGVLLPGERLPSVRALAQELGVNPNTVQKAYRALEMQGVLVTLGGKGTFVSTDVSEAKQERMAALQKLEEAVRQARDAGISHAEQVKLIEATYFEDRRGESDD